MNRPSLSRPPDHKSARPLELIETPPSPRDLEAFLGERGGLVNSYLRLYRLGECSVIVTREGDRWHLSIAHHARLPTWDEVTQARYRILPKSKTIAMILPPEYQYINVHRYCFQMIEIDPQVLPTEPFFERYAYSR